MIFEITLKSRKRYVLSSAEEALLLWYLEQAGAVLPTHLVPREVYKLRFKFPIRGPEFLQLAISACERNYNAAPHPEPGSDQYQSWGILVWLMDWGQLLLRTFPAERSTT
jgi:hypothetical protein